MTTPILREQQFTTREAIIPYAMAGSNMLAATVAARELLSPQAFLVALALIIIGLPCSVFFRQRQYNRILLNLIIMLPLLLLTWLLVRDLPGLQLDWSHLYDSLLSRDTTDTLLGMLHILVITAAGRALLLVSTKDLLQTPIPSISILLLSAITPSHSRLIETHALVLLCLLILIVSTLYLFSQWHSQRWFVRQLPLYVQRHFIVCATLGALLLFPVIVLAGFALKPFNMFTMAQRESEHRYPHFRFPAFLGNRLGISIENSVPIGGAQWPTGNQLVMTVQMDKATNLLWRGTTYDLYRDGAWRQTSRIPIPLRVSPMDGPTIKVTALATAAPSDPGIIQALKEHRITLDDHAPINHLVTQTFKVNVLGMGPQIPVYGAYQIMRYNAAQQSLRLVSRTADGALALNTVVDANGVRIMPYEVTSIIKPTPGALHLTGDPALPPGERSLYLQMPDSAYHDRVYDKARQILAEAALTPTSADFDIVRQFELYLGKHYLYTLKPSPPKDHDDPILDFLLSQKKGYCNYFSGAMVMLCRSVGIPARFVVGFATGEQVSDGHENGRITFKVTADDAHSWVEIYLHHYGWYTSDPTASSTEASNVLGRSWDFIQSMFAILKDNIANGITNVRQSPRLRGYAGLTLAGVILLFLLVRYLRRERPPVFPRETLSATEARQVILQAYGRMHRWLDRWGVLKPAGLTANEFDELFRALQTPLGEIVSQLSALYIRAQYGQEPLADADARRAIALLHELWKLSRTRRHHLHVPQTGQPAD
ncbi:MAG TPA: transglutaminase domain-containing protein [Armatimonadota bacterium]